MAVLIVDTMLVLALDAFKGYFNGPTVCSSAFRRQGRRTPKAVNIQFNHEWTRINTNEIRRAVGLPRQALESTNR
jgi:hypothetical protein